MRHCENSFRKYNDLAKKSNASVKKRNDVNKKQNASVKKSNASVKKRNDVNKRQNAFIKKIDVGTNAELERLHCLSFLTLAILTSIWV